MTPGAEDRAVVYGIISPAPSTLAKYGLSFDEWASLLEVDGSRGNKIGVCGACRRHPKSHRLNVDHEHVRGWKRMRPEDRARYVRGLVCYMCNTHRLSRGATAEVLRGCADYLDRYRVRFEGTH